MANIYELVFWVFFVLAIIVGIWYLFGSSPTFEQAILVFILGILFKLQSTVSNIKDEHIAFKGAVINSFDRIKQDILKIRGR